MVKGVLPLVNISNSLNIILLFTTCTGSLSKRNMADISGMKKVTESNASSPFSKGLAGSPFMDNVPSISPSSSTMRSGTNGLATFSGKCSKAISALRLPVPSSAGDRYLPNELSPHHHGVYRHPDDDPLPHRADTHHPVPNFPTHCLHI